MKNKILLEEPLTKIADINVKNDFTTNAIQDRIISETHKAIPLLKDIGYYLDIKNKSSETGDLIATVNLKVPSKNTTNEVRVSIPIFIHSFKMSPIDTIIMNAVAFPADDNTIKELLLDPESFRPVTNLEMQQSRLLSKLAEHDLTAFINDFKKIEETTTNTTDKIIAHLEVKAAEEYNRLKTASENYNEPILDCILQKSASEDYSFDLYYIKNNKDNIDFVKESIDHDMANLLLETMGYNTKSIKIADDLNSGKPQSYKMPMARPNDNTESLAFDPAKLDKTKMVDDIETGEARIIDAKGGQLEGYVFRLYDFNNDVNAFQTNKLFLDFNGNYCITSQFQGVKMDLPGTLTMDKPDVGETGVFIDTINDNAYGPVKILNYMNTEDEVMTVKFKNKKFTIKKIKDLKRCVLDHDVIMVPAKWEWHSFKDEIEPYENASEYVNQKIANSSFVFQSHGDEIIVTPFKKSASTAIIPSKEHLKLFFNKMNILVDNIDKLAEDITNGRKISVSTNFDMAKLFNKSADSKSLSRNVDKTPIKTAAAPNIKLTKIVTKLQKEAQSVTNLFSKLYTESREPEVMQALDSMEGYLSRLLVGDNLQEAESNDLYKKGSTFESLDTIFSLNVINDYNTAVFLYSVDKLKNTLSYLTALRMYLRFGWDSDLSEIEVNQAIESLGNIIKSLELIKTQKILKDS